MIIETLKEGEIRKICDLVEGRSGLTFGQGRLGSLSNRILERMKDLGSLSVQDYIFVLESEDSDEFRKLVDEITNQETCFFRNRPQYEALRNRILPEMIRRKTREGCRCLRIWSAGCSTGEESISLLVTTLEALSFPKAWDVQVMATDISTRALIEAREGVFSPRKLRGIEPDLIDKYFRSSEGASLTLIDTFRNMIDYRYHNLRLENFTSGWDIIFCCNVMIYFRADAKASICAKFHAALNPGGVLFIGHSETMNRVFDGFTPVYFKDAVGYFAEPSKATAGD